MQMSETGATDFYSLPT